MAISCSGMLSGKLQHKEAARRPGACGARRSPSPPSPGKQVKPPLTFLSAISRLGMWLLSGRWWGLGAQGRQEEPPPPRGLRDSQERAEMPPRDTAGPAGIAPGRLQGRPLGLQKNNALPTPQYILIPPL